MVGANGVVWDFGGINGRLERVVGCDGGQDSTDPMCLSFAPGDHTCGREKVFFREDVDLTRGFGGMPAVGCAMRLACPTDRISRQ